MIDHASAEPLTLTLPDGSARTVPAGTMPSEVVRSISERLLRDAVAVEVDGELQGSGDPASDRRCVSRPDGKGSPGVGRPAPFHRARSGHRGAASPARGEDRLWAGHRRRVLLRFRSRPAVLALRTSRESSGRCGRSPRRSCRSSARKVSRAEAQRIFADDPLKLERLSELRDDEIISVYRDGAFVDLCRGPHVPATGQLKHFKLLHTAGAYWRGDERRQMLQRIYGTAWFKKDDLDAYLFRIEEAKRRDHRVVGKQLDLFLFHPFSPGAPFWTERGTTVVNELNAYLRELQRDDYKEIKTPLLYNKGLWEISGHWGKYKENMFLVLDVESQEHDISLKPMNCPSHHLLYNSKKHSYRELPVRYNTYDVLHRNEVSGALSGLTRVRQFQQDDCLHLTSRRRRSSRRCGASRSSSWTTTRRSR